MLSVRVEAQGGINHCKGEVTMAKNTETAARIEHAVCVEILNLPEPWQRVDLDDECSFSLCDYVGAEKVRIRWVTE